MPSTANAHIGAGRRRPSHTNLAPSRSLRDVDDDCTGQEAREEISISRWQEHERAMPRWLKPTKRAKATRRETRKSLFGGGGVFSE